MVHPLGFDGAKRNCSERLSRRAFVALAVLVACEGKKRGGPLRVVSLSPSTTEAMFAIGAGELLVGRSQQCDYPAAVGKLPSVGGYADPDIERVLALSPTLVIGEQGPAGPNLEEELRGHGIDTLFPPTRSVREIEELLIALGERVNSKSGAVATKDKIASDIQVVRAWATGKHAPTVVVVFDVKPLFVAGPGGFPDELIRLAGGVNAITAGGAYPTIDIERLLALDPEVIIDATDDRKGQSRLGDDEAWSRLAAVRTGRLGKLASAAALRPGPRIAVGLAAMARAIHGMPPPTMDQP
jgi:iron complex transport system substrate-binding protein